MSYRVDGLGEASSFDAGTSVLVSGASTDVEARLLDAVAPAAGERAIVVTTNLDGGTVLDRLEERGVDREQLGVIDCTGAGGDDDRVRTLTSPGDLTGISLEFAKLLDEVAEGTPVRVGFATVSTALMYTELRTMFRFLHVFTARIRSGDQFGVFAIDPGMHDAQAHNTIRAVFDCEVRLDGDAVELRGSGFS